MKNTKIFSSGGYNANIFTKQVVRNSNTKEIYYISTILDLIEESYVGI